MALPPQDDAHTAGSPGHPEPMPSPDPGPPQPIPPPEPVPVPHPPQVAEAAPTATVAPPPASVEPAVVAGAGDTTHPSPAGRGDASGWAGAPIGAPDMTAARGEYPPVGAYPGEPGHPDQPGPAGPSPADRPGAAGPSPSDQPGWQPEERPQWQAMPVAPRKRRTTLWVSLALAITLLLCGGGGVSAFLLLRNAENGDGAPDPATAVDRFMAAVYQDQDAAAATGLLCSEARDEKKISAKVDEVKAYGTRYDTPRFAWEDPSVASESKERALVSVALTMTTGDERTARQQLTFTVVKKTGWWVCEVAG